MNETTDKKPSDSDTNPTLPPLLHARHSHRRYKQSNCDGDKISGIGMAEALEMQDKIFQAVQKFFDSHDLLLSPVCAVPTFPIHQLPTEIDGTPCTYLDTRVPGLLARMPYTPTFNMTGSRAASVPCGFTKEGLPV